MAIQFSKQACRPRSRRMAASTLALATAAAVYGVTGNAPAQDAVIPAMMMAMQSAGQAQAGDRQAKQRFDIPAGNLKQGVGAFGTQARLQLVYGPNVLDGKTTHGLAGQYTLQEALQRLLAGTGLTWEFVGEAAVAIKPGAAGAMSEPRPANKPAAKEPRQAAGDDRVVGMPAIMVQGARTLNMDITRTEDDPQPYVVFDRDVIDRSGATSLEQFLQQRLPMNTSVASMGNAIDTRDGNPDSSSINLRGLGAAQTLILVDGHRMSSPSIRGASSQGEISGIPLAAVERIEILPSTASGIYGGSATGGVINIITRKDYSGGEVRVSYDNTFSSDSAIRKLDFVFGHNFNQGRTNVLVSASYSDANTLTEADRGFLSRGRAHVWENNPDYYTTGYIPPVGRRPNFVSQDGSDLVLKSGAALGSPFASVPKGYGGVVTDGGAALAANAGQYDWELPDGTSGLGRVLYSEPMLKSGGLVLRHEVNDGLQVFADLSSSESRRRNMGTWEGHNVLFNLPAASPYNPFTTDIEVMLPGDGALVKGFSEPSPDQSSTKRDRTVIGGIKQLPGDWQMSLDFTWDRTRMDLVMAPLLDDLGESLSAGVVDVLRDLEASPLSLDYAVPSYSFAASTQSTMRDASARFGGPLGSLPAGRPMLSAALAHRRESAPDSLWQFSNYIGLMFYPARSTSVSSAYMEYRMPLFSELNARPGLRELELQFALRYEEYTSRSAGIVNIGGDVVPVPLPEPARVVNEFSSKDPTIALRWKPVEDLALRASYGTGFLPPALDNLVPTSTPLVGSFLIDPERGNTSLGRMIFTYDGNADLTPEQSKSLSAGLIFTPSWLPNLRASVDYTKIRKTNNIASFFDVVGSWQGLISSEALYPDRVVRGPNLPGDEPGWAGPIIQLDMTSANLAKLELEVWDVQLDYRWETQQHGAFDWFLVGTWQPRYAIQTSSTASMEDYIGRGARNPLQLKVNAGLTWSLSAWQAGWNISHFDSYQIITDFYVQVANQGNGGRVPSQTYHDVSFGYDFGLSNASQVPNWLAGTQVQVGIRNLLNRRPPMDASASFGYAYYSPFGSPRLASYYLTLTKRF